MKKPKETPTPQSYTEARTAISASIKAQQGLLERDSKTREKLAAACRILEALSSWVPAAAEISLGWNMLDGRNAGDKIKVHVLINEFRTQADALLKAE